MQMKYLQGIWDIRNHYTDIMLGMKDRNYGHHLLNTWGIKPEEESLIKEELETLEYLLACRLGVAHSKTAYKPTLEVVNRLFNRQLFFLEKIHRCHAYNVNKHKSPLTRKKYKTCRHYLFKFSLPAWYDKLPAEIHTLHHRNNKNLATEKDIIL